MRLILSHLGPVQSAALLFMTTKTEGKQQGEQEDRDKLLEGLISHLQAGLKIVYNSES